MMEPKISVIVPNYNSASTLPDCIQSLLNLNYPKEKLEILVVDNGSTDNSVQIIKTFPVKLITENNVKGSYAARNSGVREATGEICAFTDADCIVDRDWLRNAVKYFDAEVGGVAGKIIAAQPRTLVEEFLMIRNTFDQSRFFRHPYYPFAVTANVLYKRAVFDIVGTFETHWVSGGDVDFSWRMQMQGGLKLVFAEDCIVYHRHRTNPKALYQMSKRHIYGACLLNEKYDNKFQKVICQNHRWIVCGKIIRRQLEAWLFLMSYFLLKKKRLFFLYLSRIQALGALRGSMEFFCRQKT